MKTILLLKLTAVLSVGAICRFGSHTFEQSQITQESLTTTLEITKKINWK